MSGAAPAQTVAVPRAVVKPERRLSVAWLIPLAAAIFAVWLAWRAWSMRGVIVTVHFTEGHGISAEDPVRYRGIDVGYVRDVNLSPGLDAVDVEISLRTRADDIARAGTRFWIVRPQLGLSRIEGLETIMGSRYVAVLPGDVAAPPQHTFVGLDESPVIASVDPGDLEIVLQTPKRGSLTRGSPIIYRQVSIGRVRSVGLASDGSAVEALALIEGPYVNIVRDNSVFWDSGGLDADIGLTSVQVRVNSLETLILGGVTVATPDEPGNPVRTGHRFLVHHEPDEKWLKWQPVVAIGSDLLPGGEPMPQPLRARMTWREGVVFRSDESVHGWTLLTDKGLFGPIDVLMPNEDARSGTVQLEVAGAAVPPVRELLWSHDGVGMMDAASLRAKVESRSIWPSARMRAAAAPEDCIVVADSTDSPVPVSAARLSVGDTARTWRIDRAVNIDPSMHGACVVSRRDGFIIGMVLVNDDDEASVVLLEDQ